MTETPRLPPYLRLKEALQERNPKLAAQLSAVDCLCITSTFTRFSTLTRKKLAKILSKIPWTEKMAGDVAEALKAALAPKQEEPGPVPPELQVKIEASEAELQQVEESLTALIRCLVEQKPLDTAALVHRARSLNPGIVLPDIPSDPDPDSVLAFANALSHHVLLPRDRVHIIQLATEMGEMSIATGRRMGKWKQEQTPFGDLWMTDVRWSAYHGSAISSSTYGFVDRLRESHNAALAYQYLLRLSPDSSFADATIQAIRETRCTEERYAQLCGYERLYQEELCHGIDELYMRRHSPVHGSRDPQAMMDFFVRPGSFLARELKEAIGDDRMNIQTALMLSIIHEFSAQTQGIIRQMSTLIEAGKPGDAYLCFVDFLNDKFHMVNQLREAGQNATCFQRIYGVMSNVVLSGFLPGRRHMQEIVECTRTMSGQHPAQNALDMLKENRSREILTDEERIAQSSQ